MACRGRDGQGAARKQQTDAEDDFWMGVGQLGKGVMVEFRICFESRVIRFAHQLKIM